jgi:hypothetical protein
VGGRTGGGRTGSGAACAATGAIARWRAGGTY